MSYAQFETVVHFHVGDGCSSVRTDVNFRPGACGQFLMSGNEVGVQVGLKDMVDSYSLLIGGFQINVHIALGIDHHCFPFRRQHVRSVSQTSQAKLFEVHRCHPPRHGAK